MQEKEVVYKRLGRYPKQRLIEQVFRRDDEIRNAIWEARFGRRTQDKVAIQGHAYVSNPTEAQALRNITPLKKIELSDGFYLVNPEKWVEVIDGTYAYAKQLFKPNPSLLLAFRMWADGKHYVRVCAECDINKTAFYEVRNRMLGFALAVAAQLGLIDVLKLKPNEDIGTIDESEV